MFQLQAMRAAQCAMAHSAGFDFQKNGLSGMLHAAKGLRRPMKPGLCLHPVTRRLMPNRRARVLPRKPPRREHVGIVPAKFRGVLFYR